LSNKAANLTIKPTNVILKGAIQILISEVLN